MRYTYPRSLVVPSGSTMLVCTHARGCARVACPALICRHLHTCAPQVTEVLDVPPHESLTLHHEIFARERG